MSDYEIMLLFKSETAIHQKSLETIKSKIKETGGALEKESPLGDQFLAYPIKKQKKGYYHLLEAKLSPNNVKAINSELAMVDGLLRHLIISK